MPWDISFGVTQEFTTELACAISRCRPEQKTRATTVERAMLARVVTLLAEQPFTATLAGEYPRTILTFQQIEHPSTPPVRAAIWPYEDPWDYSLEQQARHLVTPYTHGTET